MTGITRIEALQAIRESISRGTATPIFEPDRDAEVGRLTALLEAAVIDPTPATVTDVVFDEASLNEFFRKESLFVVAHSGKGWLGFAPSVFEFFLAFGTDPNALTALGFHSGDALGEWFG